MDYKADVTLYKTLTEEQLYVFIRMGGLELPQQILADHVQKIILQCAKQCGATAQKATSRKTSKAIWAPELKPLVTASKQLHYQWKS